MTFGPRTSTSPVPCVVGRPSSPSNATSTPGSGQSDRAGLARPVDRVEGRRARALGEPVALDDRDAVAGLEAVDQLGRHGRRAADREARSTTCRARRRPAARSAWRRSQARRRSTSDEGPRRCRRTSRPRTDAVIDVAAAGGERRQHADDDAVDMEQRQDQQATVGGSTVQGVDDHVDHRDEVGVVEHDALRRAGRAARVDEQRERGRVVRDGRRHVARRRRGARPRRDRRLRRCRSSSPSCTSRRAPASSDLERRPHRR